MARVVLLVDDDPMVLEVTAILLEDLGCDVVTATNGDEALALLADNPRIEVLITDINMPGMNGFELAEKSKQMRAQLKILALSGRETDGHGIPMIRKPFLRQDLVRAMEQNTGLC